MVDVLSPVQNLEEREEGLSEGLENIDIERIIQERE